MLFRLTQILCFGALVLLGVMQLAQAVATPNNNNNKPKSVAQPQPVVSTGNQPAIPTTPKPQRLQPGLKNDSRLDCFLFVNYQVELSFYIVFPAFFRIFKVCLYSQIPNACSPWILVLAA